MFGGNPVTLDAPKTWHLPDWGRMSDAQRLTRLREIVTQYGRDPRLRKFTVDILQAAGVPQRDYPAQARAILAWVQENIYYVNEPGEILQSPDYTLKVRHGDCDDAAILLGSMYESVLLPWRFVLSGTKHGAKIRHIEGEPMPRGVRWAHIYLQVGWPAFTPNTWAYAEPTIKGVPLGWDVVANDARQLPEMQAGLAGPPVPASAPATSAPVSAGIFASMSGRAIAEGIVVGVATSVLGSLVMEAIREKREKREKNGRRR